MAKTIAEWKNSFESLFFEMCKDTGVSPTSLKVIVSCDGTATDEYGRSLSPKIKAKISID